MPKYQVYGIDDAGGIVGHRWITAQSDEDAIAAVRTFERPYECQIWRGDWRVAKVPAYRPKRLDSPR